MTMLVKEKKMNITFNKTSKSNKILSEWDVLIDDLQSQYNIIGEQHPRFKNIYSVCNLKKNKNEYII